MSSNQGEKAQKSAALRAEKRAAALRENLKRRKEQTSATKDGKITSGKDENDAKFEDSQ